MKALCVMFFTMFILCGCMTPQKLTKDQWLEQYKPATMEESDAMANLQTKLKTAEAKTKSIQSLDKFKTFCAIGFVASIVAMIAGTTLIKTLGGANLAACLGGFMLAYAGSEYAKILGIVGLVIGGATGGYAIYVAITALKQIVLGIEKSKTVGIARVAQDAAGTTSINLPLQSEIITEAIKAGQRITQSPSTNTIVKQIKETL